MGDLHLACRFGQAVFSPHGRTAHAASTTHSAATHTSAHSSTTHAAAKAAFALQHAAHVIGRTSGIVGELDVHLIGKVLTRRVMQIEPRDREAGVELGMYRSATTGLERAHHRAPVTIGRVALPEAVDFHGHEHPRLDVHFGQIAGMRIDVPPMPRKRIDACRSRCRERKNTGGGKGQ